MTFYLVSLLFTIGCTSLIRSTRSDDTQNDDSEDEINDLFHVE